MSHQFAIEVTNLHKSFGAARALQGLNLSVEAGTVAGFLGPNGSGKSTTIRILLGLLRADSGTAVLLGGDPWRDAVELHSKVAYVPGDVTLWPNLTGGEAIDILGSLRGEVNRPRIESLLNRFELDPSKKARAYSKGNRQKVALVAALSSTAELLILDEPTNGLDPLMEGVFTQCVLEAKAEGRSVLLSSHIFAEVEKVCDTVTIIRDGRTVEAGTLSELRHLQRTTVSFTVDGAIASLAGVRGINELTVNGAHVSFTVDDADLPTALTALAGVHPRGLVSTPPTLEELFLRHYSADDSSH
jgi:ABC-2 type transport system ATP-binding protein